MACVTHAHIPLTFLDSIFCDAIVLLRVVREGYTLAPGVVVFRVKL